MEPSHRSSYQTHTQARKGRHTHTSFSRQTVMKPSHLVIRLKLLRLCGKRRGEAWLKGSESHDPEPHTPPNPPTPFAGCALRKQGQPDGGINLMLATSCALLRAHTIFFVSETDTCLLLIYYYYFQLYVLLFSSHITLP